MLHRYHDAACILHYNITGEGHGFRKAESIQRALNSELNFYGMIFDFEPDIRESVPLENFGPVS